MARQYWSSPLGPLHAADGASYNTSTTITDVSPGGTAAAILIPAGMLDVGSVLKLDAFGTYAVSATTPNLTLGFYYGGVAGVVLAATAATAVTNSATVNWPWTLHYEGVVQSVGTAGTIQGRGYCDLATSLTVMSRLQMPVTAQATVAIDTTIQKIITTGATWGTNAAANIVIARYMTAELWF